MWPTGHRPFVQVNSNLQNILAYQAYIFNNQVIFYLSVTMFVCLRFFVPLENFSLIWRRHHYGTSEWLQIYARHSWPLSSEGSLTCHTYCDTGLPFIMVIYEGTCCQAFGSGVDTTCFYDSGLSRPGRNFVY